jgi:hypothetical protein
MLSKYEFCSFYLVRFVFCSHAVYKPAACKVNKLQRMALVILYSPLHYGVHSAQPCTSLNLIKAKIKQQQNSVVLVRKRTIPTERPPHVDEVSANFLQIEGVAWSAQRIPAAVFSVF